ncbi:hypothetical protein F4805DRAFT_457641 [Annulohypoxylon moriforme]|nr:hypothetical protein F4805DRAFT_457641 [Annulohypoxylon moriforme]
MSSAAIREARRRHKALKRNTRIFKNWLEGVAVRRGWVKEGNEKERITDDIAAQIDIVSQSEFAEDAMPDEVFTALANAINDRRARKDFFRSSNMSTEDFKNSHEHFIEILERASENLRRYINSPSTAPAVPIDNPEQDSEQDYEQW